MRAPPPNFRPQDLNYMQGLNTLRRSALPIALTTLLCAAATYAYEARLPNKYESVSSVLAAQDSSQNSLINNTLVTAPPLPLGAVEQALHSQNVVDGVAQRLKASSLPATDTARIVAQLELEIRTQKFQLIGTQNRLDTQQRGIYEVHAFGASPEESQALADAAVQSLLQWDTARARSGVVRAQQSLQAQVADLTTRIQAASPGSAERDALVTTLAQVSQNLAQVGVFEKAASGPLSLVAAANRPLLPVSPKPKRNSLLVGLLALLLASGVALALDTLRRRVNSAEDLRRFGAPVLGELPKISSRNLTQGYLAAAMGGATYEAVGYLRVSLEEFTPRHAQRRLVVSSARPGEGKSSVAASLAQSFALAGHKVLLIDADTHRPTQQQIWKLPAEANPDALLVGTTSTHTAQRRPISVAENIDLIPAGPPRDAARVLNQPAFEQLLGRWAEGYGVVVIDTPPLLSVSDALSINRYTDGLVFVVEAGRTHESEVARAVQTLSTSRTELRGFVLNKTTPQNSGYEAYSYTRTDAVKPGTRS